MVDEKLKKELETTAAQFERYAPAMESAQKIQEGAVTVIGWHVGVASPGFLGLVWYIDRLTRKSWLHPQAFALLYVGAELAFLVSIISAVLLYNRFSSSALGITTQLSIIQRFAAVMKNVASSGETKWGDDNELNDLVEKYGRIYKMLTADNPWYVRAGIWAHGKFTLLGYILMAVILACYKF